MSDSPLVSKRVLTDNNSGPRAHAIDTITPHYMCWYTDAETCAQSFVPSSRQASANYCIGKDGDIVLSVPEVNRAWTSGNAANDNRAVTIECANYMDTGGGHEYGQLPDATWRSLVALCADICQRNGKSRLVYRGSANYDGLTATDMLLTKHRWFQDTDCPGPWFDNQFDRLAGEVNSRLGAGTINLADVAAQIHYDMVIDPNNGYSQGDRWGGQLGQTKTLIIAGRSYTYNLGDYDCASSVITAWRLALSGTSFVHSLDGATFTGDMEDAFVGSGLFESSFTAARRGDLYLRPKTDEMGGHTAMCQDGGNDNVFGYDCLSEFNRNELHMAVGGQVGDQDGEESVFRDYYDGPWTTVLHYNHRADIPLDNKKEEAKQEPEPLPEQPTSQVKNTNGIFYRAHCERVGWLPAVRDGQIAGTVGESLRLEALKVTPPAGMVLDAYTHEQGIGNCYYDGIHKGKSSGTGSSKNDPVIGTVGQGRRIEAIMFRVTKWPKSLKGKTFMYQVHQRGVGWMDSVTEGHWAGTRGKGTRIEAVRIWIE